MQKSSKKAFTTLQQKVAIFFIFLFSTLVYFKKVIYVCIIKLKTMKTITPKEIFKAGQILNLDVIPSLIGKTIAITSPEYSSNSVSVRTFKVLGLESEFEAAAKQPVEGYESRQEMWLKENNQSAIKWAKSRTVLIHEGDEPFARVADDNVCLDKGTFFGSDADREVYYLIVE